MTAPRPAPRPDALPARTTLVLRVLVVAAFVVILNETIMSNALPQLMAVFGVDARAGQWLTAGFMLTMAVVIPTTGWFLGRVGIRRAFMTAMGAFVAGTALATFAPTFGPLLLARVVQACGTAVMMPLLMSTVLSLVPERHRGTIMGNVSLAIAVAPALGPTISGIVLGFTSWRWLFGLGLPIAIVVGLAGARLLREVDEPGTGDLDPVSVVLVALGFGGVVYGLSQLGGHAGAGVPPALALGVGLVGLALFVWRQAHLVRHGTPLLDLRVLRNCRYLVAVSILSLSFMALMGAMILLPLFLQDARGLSTLEAGLLLMPGSLTMGLLGPVVGRLFDRVGPFVLAVPGAVVVAVGLGLMSVAAAGAPWWVFLVLHVAVGVALAFVFTPMFTTGLSALAPHLYAHGSALLGTLQQVAAAAGTALVITVMTVRQGALAAGGRDPVAALSGGVGVGFGLAAALATVVVVLSLLLPRGPLASEPEPAAAPVRE